jgi:hypothetical protein
LERSQKTLSSNKHFFSKVRRHKINIKTSEAFVYTNNKRAENEIRKVLPFTLSKLHKISMNKPNKRRKTCKIKMIKHQRN